MALVLLRSFGAQFLLVGTFSLGGTKASFGRHFAQNLEIKKQQRSSSQMPPSRVGPVAFFVGKIFNLTFGGEDQKQKKMSLSQMHSSGVCSVTFCCSTILAWRAYFSLGGERRAQSVN